MWHKIIFNKNNIETETGSATLIKLPSKSDYPDYKFWHPSKLVREHNHRTDLSSFSFTDNFEFSIFKNGNGKTNRYDKIDEITLTARDIMTAFDNEVYKEEVLERNKDSFLDVIKPVKIEVEGNVDSCLMNN